METVICIAVASFAILAQPAIALGANTTLHLIFHHLSLFLWMTSLAAFSLQNLARVDEGEGGVGSQGNSWLS